MYIGSFGGLPILSRAPKSFPAEPSMRLLSASERLWLVADRIAPVPFVIQFVAEGDGDIPFEALQSAVQLAAEAHPGLSLRLSGVLGWSHWQLTGNPPPVMLVDGRDWDGRSPAGAGFLRRPLNPAEGQGCEVLLVRGEPTRVVVRAHHALMDGVAVREFVYDIFRALRCEPLVGSLAGPASERDIGRLLPQSTEKAPPPEFRSITGDSDGQEGATWARVTVKAGGGQVLPRIVEGLIRAAAEYSGGPWRIGIPVDIRRHLPGLRSSANLTGLLQMQGGEGDFEAEAVHRRIRDLLADQQECLTSASADRIRWIPVTLLELLL